MSSDTVLGTSKLFLLTTGYYLIIKHFKLDVIENYRIPTQL